MVCHVQVAIKLNALKLSACVRHESLSSPSFVFVVFELSGQHTDDVVLRVRAALPHLIELLFGGECTSAFATFWSTWGVACWLCHG